MPSERDLQAYHNPDLSQSITERVKAIAAAITQDPDYNGWDTNVLKHAQLVSAAPGKTIFQLVVQSDMCNKAGNLHGGCSTTILDNLTSTSLLTIAREGFLDAGTVSRTLTMTFLRPVPVGTKVRIVSEIVSAGKTLAHVKGQIELSDGKVAVTCTHDKAVVPKLWKL